MAVVNLGQLGPARESDAAEGLRTAKDLVSMGVAVSSAATAAKNAGTAATNATTRQGELTQAIASSEITKTKMDIDHVDKTHKAYSAHWNSLDAQGKQVFQTSDQYKEYQKFFKGFKNITPGLIDDQGNIVAKTNAKMYQEGWDENVAQAKQRLADDSGSQEDINIIKLDKTAGTETVASALEDLEKAIEQKEVDRNNPKDVEGFMQRWWRVYKYATNEQKKIRNTIKNQGAEINSNMARQEEAIMGNANTQALAGSNDPLGILGR